MIEDDKPTQLLGMDDLNDPNAVFVQPNIDIKLSADKRRECRDIVKEIMSFGVSQRQVLFIVQLLALELESREIMLRILKSVTESREDVPTGMIDVSRE